MSGPERRSFTIPPELAGARLAHRLPVKQLRMVFALMFYGLALRMLTTLW